MIDEKFLVKIGFIEYWMTEKQANDFLEGLDTAEETKDLSEHKKEFVRFCVNKSIEFKVKELQ